MKKKIIAIIIILVVAVAGCFANILIGGRPVDTSNKSDIFVNPILVLSSQFLRTLVKHLPPYLKAFFRCKWDFVTDHSCMSQKRSPQAPH